MEKLLAYLKAIDSLNEEASRQAAGAL